jgi:hypothetical protein
LGYRGRSISFKLIIRPYKINKIIFKPFVSIPPNP